MVDIRFKPPQEKGAKSYYIADDAFTLPEGKSDFRWNFADF